jgi:hypothetical protein
MAKKNTAFVCTECGADTPRWSGQCSACQEWNTIKEVRLASPETYKTLIPFWAILAITCNKSVLFPAPGVPPIRPQ